MSEMEMEFQALLCFWYSLPTVASSAAWRIATSDGGARSDHSQSVTNEVWLSFCQ